MKINIIILTFIAIFMLSACEKNQAPEINSISSLTEIVVGGSEVILAVDVSDEDGDILTYSWSASGGEFLSNVTSDTVVWIVPTTIADESYTITVDVSDGELTGGNSISISVEGGKFIDLRDENIYDFVQIGEQIWMAENLAYLLKVSPSSDGSYDDLFFYVYGYEGSNLTDAKNESNFGIYGVLYNWPAAMNSCPNGWHLPSNEEFQQMIGYIGGGGVAGGKLKETGTLYWNTPNEGATNLSGFSARPGGVMARHPETTNWTFHSLGESTSFWTSTPRNDNAFKTAIKLGYSHSYIDIGGYHNALGMSVRCIKD